MKKVLVWLLALPLLFSGCAAHEEVDDLTFVRVLGIDRRGEKTVVTACTVTQEKENFFLSVEGTSLPECLEALKGQSDLSLFFGHTELILWGEEAARSGTLGDLDAFVRSGEFRFDLLALTVKGEAEALLRGMGGDGEQICDRLKTLLKNAPRTAAASAIPLSRMITVLEEPFCGVYLPYAVSEGARVFVAGYGLFADDRLAVLLDSAASRGLCLLSGGAEEYALTVPDGAGSTTLKLTDFSADAAINDGTFSLTLSGLAEITGTDTAEDWTEERLNTLLAEAQARLKNEAEQAIEAMKAVGCDALNLGGHWERKAPRQAENAKDRWPETFRETDVTVSVNLNMNPRRAVGRPLKKRESDT